MHHLTTPHSSDHPFDADTKVEATADDTFTATISDRWNALAGSPNGGYLLAVCLQALRQTMPFPDPLGSRRSSCAPARRARRGSARWPAAPYRGSR